MTVPVGHRNTIVADRRFVERAMNATYLTRDRELDLARRWRDGGDRMAMSELVTAYLRFAIAVAAKFRGYGLPLGDLVQEASIGIMQAAARFDPERGLRFSTYARWWIRAAIQEFVLRNWSIVRIGTTAAQRILFFRLRTLRAKLEGTPGHNSDDGIRATIARDLDVPEPAVDAMTMRLAARDQSLNAPLGANTDVEFQDILVDASASPEDIAIVRNEGRVHARWIDRAMRDELTERERTIVRERRMSDVKPTLGMLGARYGISRERVRQIEGIAMAKLRRAIESKVGNPFAHGPPSHRRAGAVSAALS